MLLGSPSGNLLKGTACVSKRKVKVCDLCFATRCDIKGAFPFDPCLVENASATKSGNEQNPNLKLEWMQDGSAELKCGDIVSK